MRSVGNMTIYPKAPQKLVTESGFIYFCEPQTQKPMPSLRQVASSLFMITTLLWLTVSTPLVYACQQVQKELQQQPNGHEDKNLYANTTEEKSETGTNLLSEYRHDIHLLERHFIVLRTLYKCHSSHLYPEYYPELQSPPPEA